MQSLLIAMCLFLPAPPHAHARNFPVYFTSYNPEKEQCDSDPCVGAGLVDLCQRAREGGRTIALSQDLVGRAPWKPFHYHDVVRLTSDVPQCNGEFMVEDTMNARYNNRGDIFFMDRKDNVGCTATIEKVPPNSSKSE